jgi:hypothetical protein
LALDDGLGRQLDGPETGTLLAFGGEAAHRHQAKGQEVPLLSAPVPPKGEPEEVVEVQAQLELVGIALPRHLLTLSLEGGRRRAWRRP